MTDLFKSLTGSKSIQALIFGWFVPVVITSLAFVVQLLPTLRTSAAISRLQRGAHELGLNGATFFVLTTLLAAISMSLVSRLLYRMLEGYYWRSTLLRWRYRAHMQQWTLLENERRKRQAEATLRHVDRLLRELEDRTTRISWRPNSDFEEHRKQLRHEKAEAILESRRASRTLLSVQDIGGNIEKDDRRRSRWGVGKFYTDYPDRSERVLGTMFGNRMRSFESYGSSQFGLDSQTLWYELTGVASEAIRNSLDDIRIAADFFVALLYCSGALASTCVIVSILVDSSANIAATFLLSVAVISLCYRQLLSVTIEWRYAVSALVNTGRKPLAEALGLELPQSISDEIRMWDAMTNATFYRSQDWLKRLDEWRGSDGSKE